MKKIHPSEMQEIQGGTLQRACFVIGFATVVSFAFPFNVVQAWPGIKYCWNN